MTKRRREPNFKPFIEPTTVSNKQNHKILQIHCKTTNYNQNQEEDENNPPPIKRIRQESEGDR